MSGQINIAGKATWPVDVSRFIWTVSEDTQSSGNHTTLHTALHEVQFVSFGFQNSLSGIISKRQTESAFFLRVYLKRHESDKFYHFFFTVIVVKVNAIFIN
jgi:hypothetical protein